MARARRTSPVAQEAPLTNQRLRAHQENEAVPLQVKYVLLRDRNLLPARTREGGL